MAPFETSRDVGSWAAIGEKSGSGSDIVKLMRLTQLDIGGVSYPDS
jgi:hypothetical protein